MQLDELNKHFIVEDKANGAHVFLLPVRVEISNGLVVSAEFVGQPGYKYKITFTKDDASLEPVPATDGH